MLTVREKMLMAMSAEVVTLMYRDGLDFKSATKQVVAVFPAYGPELWEAYFTSEKNMKQAGR